MHLTADQLPSVLIIFYRVTHLKRLTFSCSLSPDIQWCIYTPSLYLHTLTFRSFFSSPGMQIHVFTNAVTETGVILSIYFGYL